MYESTHLNVHVCLYYQEGAYTVCVLSVCVSIRHTRMYEWMHTCVDCMHLQFSDKGLGFCGYLILVASFKLRPKNKTNILGL